MKIVQTYSHLNGLEYLLVHKKKLWLEVLAVIKSIDATQCKTKVSNESRMKGETKYSPIDMNKEFHQQLTQRAWAESRVTYWVTDDEKLIRQTLTMRNYVATAQGFSPAKTGRLASITLPRLGFEHSHIRH